jgi:UDP-glucose 4-epimerase
MLFWYGDSSNPLHCPIALDLLTGRPYSMILVTGGAGYIGSHFVKHYLESAPSESVVVVDSLAEGHLQAIQSIGFAERLKFIQADIGESERMRAIFGEYPIEAVVHFSAFAYVGESSQDPLKYYKNNVENSLHLFQVMEECGVRNIVFSSTCATYGNPVRLPLDEMHPQAPINVYGETKLMVEMMLRSLHRCKGWSCVPLRYFNAAGADPEGKLGESHHCETHLIPLVLQAAKGERASIAIYGDDYDTPDGTCIRDYIHVNDLARAHSLALKYVRSGPVFEPINLGTACGASVKEVIDICREVTGRDIPVEVEPRRVGDPPVLIANSRKAQALLGWHPAYGLKDSIETAWQWEMNRLY